MPSLFRIIFFSSMNFAYTESSLVIVSFAKLSVADVFALFQNIHEILDNFHHISIIRKLHKSKRYLNNILLTFGKSREKTTPCTATDVPALDKSPSSRPRSSFATFIYSYRKFICGLPVHRHTLVPSAIIMRKYLFTRSWPTSSHIQSSEGRRLTPSVQTIDYRHKFSYTIHTPLLAVGKGVSAANYFAEVQK